ncbi:threo-3-hydroxyaspartate ammonia-lyase [Arthroderma uncinatum]|uniref:threo-3-hydroxyaspartate ammonia-lyase n=1 Tax=Arthroderma uncinatum TaxID=74035 RepID=UPI00144ADFF3|nr:threo-3-hydroxyaspartate ammonia-lyase [Arthroderma uncinatum]KAF3482641.1 threo-3-hydroxyaspartate ammonia-lyase [Arthroderma uncinatum]
MTDKQHWLPITQENIQKAHSLVKPYIYETPVLTCKTLNSLASTPQTPDALKGTPFEGQQPARPKINFFFKCENFQRIGAFKVRGAFHSILRVIQTKGNHAQAVALAASTLSIPAYIIMPSISLPSKIEATKGYGGKVIFSGSTSDEREAVVRKAQEETGAILIHPYDHPDTVLGQGTAGLELEAQVNKLVSETPGLSVRLGKDGKGCGLDAVITPLGGGGLNSGTASFFAEPRENGKKIYVFGAEPSFQGADDARRGLKAGERIPAVKSLTIADGLRTPMGEIAFSILSDSSKSRGVFSVTEEQIKSVMKLVVERMKIVIEPSAAVPLAVCLFDEEFRQIVEREAGEDGWNVGVIFSGGNTTIEAMSQLFATSSS